MRLSRDQLLAQNFDAVLAVTVKLVGDSMFGKVLPGCVITHSRTPMHFHRALLVRGPGWGQMSTGAAIGGMESP